MLSSLLLPALRERFPDRGMVADVPPGPCAMFPGIHAGIRSVSIYDDGSELIVSIDDFTQGHFAEYAEGLSDAERSGRVVDSALEFLEALFADQIAVWGRADTAGGWYRTNPGGVGCPAGVQKFVWSGPLVQKHA